MEWYAVIADAHLNFQEASDSADGKLHPSFGDGPSYRKYMIALLKDLENKEMNIVVLGDFLDGIQTEGPNKIHKVNEVWAKKKMNEDPLFRSAVNDYFELSNLVKNDKCIYIAGNHEDPYKMKELGIELKDEIYQDPFTFVHGHKHDLPVKIFGFNPGQISHRVLSGKMPSLEENKPLERKISAFMKFVSRFIGWGGLMVDNGVKNLISLLYGEKKDGISELRSDDYARAYEYSRSNMGIRSYKPFAVIGHEHKPSLHENGVVIGDAYSHGISFVGYDGKDVYVALGMKRSEKEYFERGHLWKYSLRKKAWKFLQEITGSDFLQTLTSYGAGAQGGPSQKAQAASPE